MVTAILNRVVTAARVLFASESAPKPAAREDELPRWREFGLESREVCSGLDDGDTWFRFDDTQVPSPELIRSVRGELARRDLTLVDDDGVVRVVARR